MKKILLSLAIIGVVAGVVIGVTGAYFTDEEPITNNVFQAGTLDIQQGANDLGNMTLSGLIPGVATIPQKLTMGNNGTLHAIVDKIEVTSLTNGDTAGTSNDISAADYAAMVNTTISDEIGRPLWKGTLAELNGGDAIDGTDRVFLAKKGTGGNYTTRDYWFTFELDENATNAYQDEGVKATFAVNASQVKDDKFDAAERLVMNQNSDNGWDWVQNNEKTTASSKNLFGVIGTGLLRGYEFSGNSDYFDSAEKAAWAIKNGDVSFADPKWVDNYPANASILFLQRMGKYYNDGNAFSNAAENAVIDRWNAYHNNAQEVYTNIKIARESGNPDLFYWDLAPLMEATIDAANTVSDSGQATTLRNNALALAALVVADQHSTGGYFITNWNNVYSQLGQASAIRILQLADDMDFGVSYSAKITSGVNALLTQQNGDGSFRYGTAIDGKNIQTNAYAALVLEMAGNHTEAQATVDNLVSQRLSNGAWNHSEPDGNSGTSVTIGEYPEVNSEALRAIISINQ